MKQTPRSLCPISLALDLFGDAWSLLIIRDLMFKGIDSYNGFLVAGEGIATNILASRLSRLERDGLIEGQRDAGDRRRTLYRLTEKGIDLAPVMVSLVLWSARHRPTDAPPHLVEAMREDPSGFAARVIAQWHEARAQPSPAAVIATAPAAER